MTNNTKGLAGLIVFAGIALATVGATQCGSRYNTIIQKVPNAESDYVYGDIDGPALQAKNQYETDSTALARAAAIRKKMFGDTDGGGDGDGGSTQITSNEANSSPADTTKSDTTQAN